MAVLEQCPEIRKRAKRNQRRALAGANSNLSFVCAHYMCEMLMILDLVDGRQYARLCRHLSLSNKGKRYK